MVAWLIIGFLIWQKVAMEAEHKRFVTIVNILTEIQQSVKSIEKEGK